MGGPKGGRHEGGCHNSGRKRTLTHSDLNSKICTDWTTEQLDNKWLLVKNYVLSTPPTPPVPHQHLSLYIALSRITEAVVGGGNRRHCQEVPWY